MIFREYGHFIFDLDGTLIDSFGDIRFSLEVSYLKILNREVEVSRNYIGPPLSKMIDQLTPEISDEHKQAIVTEFRDNYDNSSYPFTTEIPGAIVLLQQLKSSGKKLYLATNKSYVPTLRLIEKFRMNNTFTDIVTPDKTNGRKFSKTQLIESLMRRYEMDPKKAVMIGDTASDIFAAKHNSIDSICTTEGYDSIENLNLANPTRIVNNLFELQLESINN